MRIRHTLAMLGGAIALVTVALPLTASELPDTATGRERARARVAAAEAELTEAQRVAVESFRAQHDRQTKARSSAPAAGRLRKTLAGDDLQQVVVAKRNADGTLTLSCVENAGEFAEFLVAPPESSRPERQEQ